jgi:DNA-binding NarL/FixJ family response regulator
MAAHPVPDPGTAPLVGREREQATLRAALDAALTGRGSLVLIGGEAGIGKTALAEWLCGEAADRGALVLVGRCYDLSETPPYGPWLEVIAQYPAGAPDLPPVPAVMTDREALAAVASQAALFDRVIGWFAAVAAVRPLVLLLDDLHWADPASLDLLRLLARRAPALRLLLLVTYRSDELTRRHPLYALLPVLERETRAIRLDLRRWNADAVRAVVADRYALVEGDAARLVAWLVGRAEGNAFFATQLLRALEDERVLLQTPEGWVLGDLGRVGLSTALRQVLDARLARLGDEAQQLLALAAVIGQDVPLALWATVAETDEDGLLDTIERAVEAHLLTEVADGGAMRFAHALIREALYASLLATRRRRVHRRVAEALVATANADADAVAYHFRQAGDARAVAWLVTAGERALRAYAWVTTAARYEAALALLDVGEATAGERGWLLYRLGRMRRFTDLAQALGYYEEAWRLAEEAGDHALAATALCDLGVIRWSLGVWVRGLEDLAAGVEALEALPPAERARLNRLDALSSAADTSARRGTLISGLANMGRYAEALAMGASYLARTLAPTPGGGRGASAYADAQYGQGKALAMLGRSEEARVAFALARGAYRTVEHFFLLGTTAASELQLVQLTYRPEWLEERERLAQEGEQALARARDAGITQIPQSYARLPLLVLEGRWTEAHDVVSAGAFPNPSFEQFATALLGLLAREQGKSAIAWAMVRAALPQGQGTEPGEALIPEALLFQRLAALLALDAGDLPTTQDWLAAHDRWLAWSSAVLGKAEGHLGWAAYHRAAGDLATAHQHAEAALEDSSDPRQPLALLAAHRLLGELDTAAGQHEAATAHLDAALSLADACAAPYERALTLLAVAELHSAESQPDQASIALAEARALLVPLDARPALARADALAAPPPPVPATPAALPFGLTAREAEVLALVAAGLSDAAVAERLFLSRFTVKAHMRAVYGKLGTSSRTAAARLARDHGLAP